MRGAKVLVIQSLLEEQTWQPLSDGVMQSKTNKSRVSLSPALSTFLLTSLLQ